MVSVWRARMEAMGRYDPDKVFAAVSQALTGTLGLSFDGVTKCFPQDAENALRTLLEP